jgi:chromosome segregation ATPase
MSGAMELSQDALEQIGEYVKRHIPEWVRDTPEMQREYDLRERIVRVEEELKKQRELMERGFDTMNTRFKEQTNHFNARFEAIDKRFEEQTNHFNARFEAIDRRFEEQTNHFNTRFDAIDRRFQDMNGRFEDLQKHTNRWMTLIAFFLAVIGAMLWMHS